MRLVRFSHNSEVGWGMIEGEVIFEVESFTSHRQTGRKFRADEVKLLAPCTPSKIIAVGLNYTDHAEELGMALPEEPIIFMKPASAVIGHEDYILLPSMSERVDYEAELAAVIGKTAKDLSPQQASDVILGYTCLNDVTARDLQKKDGQWTRAKSFDTFCPIGPWVTNEVEPLDLEVKLLLNGEVKQCSRTSKLIFSVFELVSFVSKIMTLYPGDVISTGTPAGVGPMREGDVVEVVVEGVGVLRNRVKRG